jgi:hypothetical protein
MKPWLRNEPLDADVSGTAQFEGRTAEEAVARARAALGDAGGLRCWKTRRGGVGGFFAKEVFVAGLTPPPGSETTRSRASRAEPGEARGGSDPDPVPHAAPYDGTTRAAGRARRGSKDKSIGPEDHLSGLVEATSDQVSLRSLAIPAEAFDQVLAEAEAALTREHEGNGVTIPRALENPLPQTFATEEQGISEPEPALPVDGAAGLPPDLGEHAVAASAPESSDGGDRPASAPPAKKPSRPKPKAGRTPPAPRSTTAAKSEQRSRPARMPDLRPGLRSLGVPDSYLPRGQRPSLDQLAAVMGTMPVSPALPTRTGAVVAVVASGSNLDRTVDLLTPRLSIGQRDVLRFGGSPGATSLRSADLPSAEGARLGRQIARRRASGRTSLLAVAAAPGAPLGRDLRGLLDQVAPDYVLAAVGAHCKRVDMEHWVGELPAVDAMALWDLSATRTPAELLGVLPIAFVDGEPASSLAWTLLLARRAMGHGGR